MFRWLAVAFSFAEVINLEIVVVICWDWKISIIAVWWLQLTSLVNERFVTNSATSAELTAWRTKLDSKHSSSIYYSLEHKFYINKTLKQYPLRQQQVVGVGVSSLKKKERRNQPQQIEIFDGVDGWNFHGERCRHQKIWRCWWGKWWTCFLGCGIRSWMRWCIVTCFVNLIDHWLSILNSLDDELKNIVCQSCCWVDCTSFLGLRWLIGWITKMLGPYLFPLFYSPHLTKP